MTSPSRAMSFYRFCGYSDCTGTPDNPHPQWGDDQMIDRWCAGPDPEHRAWLCEECGIDHDRPGLGSSVIDPEEPTP